MSHVTSSDLRELFKSIQPVEAGGHAPGAVRRRLLAELPFDVFAEVRFPERDWALVVDTPEQLTDRDLVLMAGLTCRARGGQVEVVNRQRTNVELYCALLTDLMAHLATTRPTAPAAALVNRLDTWQRMLSRGPRSGLTPQQRLGLFGELHLLTDVMVPWLGEDAVGLWQGPTGAANDFVAAQWAVEVKTVPAPSAGSCRISSENQLDATVPLVLAHYVVRNDPDGIGLADLVDEARAQTSLAVRTVLENRLLEAGWLDAQREQYALDAYAVSRRSFYQVRAAFPRLVRGDLPPGVRGVSYEIDIATCEPYRLTHERTRQLLTTGHQEGPRHG